MPEIYVDEDAARELRRLAIRRAVNDPGSPEYVRAHARKRTRGVRGHVRVRGLRGRFARDQDILKALYSNPEREHDLVITGTGRVLNEGFFPRGRNEMWMVFNAPGNPPIYIRGWGTR